ncbi:hypothetical protein POMI540_4068 [Schizosaccharomyces pombe]
MAPAVFTSDYWKKYFSNKKKPTVKNTSDIDLLHINRGRQPFDEGLSINEDSFFYRHNIHVPRIVYLIIVACGSFIITGGIEFAIAYGMYKKTETSVRLWRLPDTLSGDAAVTNFVQAIVTYWVESILVQGDLRSGLVKPIYFGWWPENFLLREVLRAKPRYHFKFIVFRWMEWLVFVGLRGLVWSVPLWFLFWPATVGILCAPGRHEGNDYYFNNYPAPQVFKLIFGGGEGFILTPWIAFLHMYMYGHYLHVAKNQKSLPKTSDLEQQRGTSSSQPSENNANVTALPKPEPKMYENSDLTPARTPVTPAPLEKPVNLAPEVVEPTNAAASPLQLNAPKLTDVDDSALAYDPTKVQDGEDRFVHNDVPLENAENPSRFVHSDAPIDMTHTTTVISEAQNLPSTLLPQDGNAVHHDTDAPSLSNVRKSVDSPRVPPSFSDDAVSSFSLVTAPSINNVGGSTAPSVNNQEREYDYDDTSSRSSTLTERPVVH